MLLETELVVDAFVDEGLEVTAATEELVVTSFADEELGVTAAIEELVASFVEDSALVGVEESGTPTNPDEEAGAARAGTAAPTRIKTLLNLILTISSERLIGMVSLCAKRIGAFSCPMSPPDSRCWKRKLQNQSTEEMTSI